MLFNSYIFILLFLPIVVLGYYLLGRRNTPLTHVFLIGMSLWFYGYFNPWYLFILCGSILINYGISRILSKNSQESIKKNILIIGIIFNVGLIFYFKYLGFFEETLNATFKTDIVVKDIILPLGISFFTFQQISFLVDSYKGQTKDYGFIEYALFVSFFPQLVAGPIVLHNELIPQFRDDEKKILNLDNLYSGIVLFSFGLFKKVLLADTFSRCVVWAFENTNSLTSLEIFTSMISYTLQIYFDFSAYSDMATGIARMLNITLPMNFNSPYKALDINDFWKRWHMTLTRFLREYIYFPLGGNRKGPTKTYINIMIVYLISGIWHGANWTFILWGLLHGLACVVHRMCQKSYSKLHTVFQWAITFLYVNVLWLLFRADSISQWLKMVLRMVKMENLSIRQDMLDQFALPEKPFIFNVTGLNIIESKNPAFLTIFIIIIGLAICMNHRNNYQRTFSVSKRTVVAAALALAASIVSLSGVSEFIYFNF